MLFVLTGCNTGSNTDTSLNIPVEKNWSSPVPFLQSGGHSTAAMDNQGNIIIVTWDYNESNSHYELIRHEFRDGVWVGPELISNIPNQPYNAAYNPTVSMDNNGNAIIIWYQTGDAALIITEYRGGSWSSPRALSSLVRVSGGHSIAMNDLGSAFIVWQSNNNIYRSEWIDGVWSSPVSMSTDSIKGPKIKINNKGNGVIIWLENNYDTIVSSELVRGEWSLPKNIGITNAISSPNLGIDSNGNAIVVWEKSVGPGLRQIYKNEFKNSLWTGEQAVSADGISGYYPSMAMSENGNAVVAWRQLFNSTTQIYRREYVNGDWSAPSPVSLAGINSRNPFVQMDPSGNAILVWNEENGASWQVMMSQLSNGAWSDGEYFTISDNTLNVVNYDIDINLNGEAIFVWGQSDNGIWYEYRSQYQ